VWQGAWHVAAVNPDDNWGAARKVLAGWNEGTWSGSGESGWIWNPTLEGLLVGDGTEWIGPMTKEQAMLLVWRVKSWKLQVGGASASVTVASPYGPHGSSELGPNSDINYIDTAGSEANVICGRIPFVVQANGLGSPVGKSEDAKFSQFISGPRDPQTEYIGSAATLAYWSIGASGVAVDVDNEEDYYVYFPITVLIKAVASLWQYEIYLELDSYITNNSEYGIFQNAIYEYDYVSNENTLAVPAEWKAAPVTAEIAGYGASRVWQIRDDLIKYTNASGNHITLNLGTFGTINVASQLINRELTDAITYYPTDPWSPVIPISSSISSVTLSPFKWWPYTKSDGSPTYNEDTGEAL
jgi:hypothetical protein